jgi:hypothetical protein
MSKKIVVPMEFPNKILAEQFLTWLSEHGEPDFYTFTQSEYEEETGSTFDCFDYDFEELSVSLRCIEVNLSENDEDEDLNLDDIDEEEELSDEDEND